MPACLSRIAMPRPPNPAPTIATPTSLGSSSWRMRGEACLIARGIVLGDIAGDEGEGTSMPTRNGSAEWRGDLQGGSGDLTVGNGVFEGNYSFASRFEEG